MNGKKLTALTFYLALAIAATGMAVSPKGGFSQAEQRSLASLPTLSSVWDGSSGEKLEDYLADHFPLRTEWMSLRTRLQQLTGRKVVQDVYLLHDRLMERTDPISEESVKQSTAAVMEIAGRFSGATSLMLIPSAVPDAYQHPAKFTAICFQMAFPTYPKRLPLTGPMNRFPSPSIPWIVTAPCQPIGSGISTTARILTGLHWALIWHTVPVPPSWDLPPLHWIE